MSFVVIYDANVLFPAPLRDLLMHVALTGVVQARWSGEILDECFANILVKRPNLTSDSLVRTRRLMNRALPDALVTGYEPSILGLSLPDPNDRHVVAAAIHAGAQVIVTMNLKDFPASALERFGIEAKHPDQFLCETLELEPLLVEEAFRRQVASLKNPSKSETEVLETLKIQGLTEFVSRLRRAL